MSYDCVMVPIDRKYVNNSEIQFRLIEEMKSLKKEFDDNGYKKYAKKMSEMIAEFRIKYGADLI